VVHSGRIVFIALTLSGTRHALYRHATGDGRNGYFDEKGQSARKALLRTPVDGARLSSSFGRRRHPVLGYTRMHRGLDFRAPPGTPIYAAGKGIVEYVGRNGAYGRYVRIRHNSSSSTAYAHMRRFARGLGKGKRVEQGQIIGYVGSSGRSTGPHLHYEILRGGRQVNPLTVTMPAGPRLKGWEMSRFRYAMSKITRQFADLAVDLAVAGGSDE
jgi:murein DD-endopeptidase MepM/ murein hydrolase activator NlpD